MKTLLEEDIAFLGFILHLLHHIWVHWCLQSQMDILKNEVYDSEKEVC